MAPSPSLDVRCTGHGRKAKRNQAGPATRNAGRWFYTCPLGKDDRTRCKFFKWEDEVGVGGPATPARQAGGNTLGGSPLGLVGVGRGAGGGGGETTPRAPGRPLTAYFRPADEPADDIDWSAVDAASLEADAIAATPTPVKPAASSVAPSPTPAALVSERLFDAAPKRKRESLGIAGGRSPKRGGSANPFLEDVATPAEVRPVPPVAETPRRRGVGDALTPSTGAASPAHEGNRPPHAALAPTLASLDGLNEHLARQDRLVRAAEAMKKSMRETIRTLQARVKELEDELARK
ncbi:hypothetical protein Q8F55_002405 [Vanrija albida]|uniref:GRF-type domain-containing protein n=1 Tax=Vanrija albida TaxID=181172 RepID=A0ABR3Q9Q8_9TREE